MSSAHQSSQTKMKTIRIGIAAAFGCAFIFGGWIWQRGEHSTATSRAYSPAIFSTDNSKPAATVVSPMQNFPVVQKNNCPTNAVESASTQLADTMAFITRRLHDWKLETDPDKRKEILNELLPLLTDENAAAIVKALPSELLDTDFASAALRRWVGSDRRAAADWMAAQSGAPDFLAGLITYGWLQQDPDGLHKYLEGLPAGAWKENILSAAAENALTASEPLEAVNFAGKMQAGEQRNALFNNAVEQWAQNDPQAAANWVAEISDSQFRAELNESVVVGFAATDPEKAAELVTQSIAAGEPMPTAAADVTGIWSAKDPAAAADWIAQSLQGQTQQLALQIVMNQWGYQNLAATQTWIANLPPGEFRDEAEILFANVKNVVEAN